ncbi:hypothetical protein QKC54_gp0932 [Megavirus baoshan]|uniref:Ankyrin repeat protein n=1 Tax=Megavirus baoshan TaxID=2496520 RepID=A0A8K1T299_9VIRU|nr:hypothetical protein QKC54_gp0932 [Megavirus baoshan]UFX99742.1 hypothetical protein Mb0140 [Megavirus baoshan]
MPSYTEKYAENRYHTIDVVKYLYSFGTNATTVSDHTLIQSYNYN